MAKYYEFTGETKGCGYHMLHRIRATKDLPQHDVKSGDVGGWIESEKNLFGNAWVSGNARVFGNARVYGNALVFDNARVSGNALIYDYGRVCDDAQVRDNAVVYDNAWISGNAIVSHYATVQEEAQVCDDAWISGKARIRGKAKICGDADYIVIGPMGSRSAHTTFYHRADGETMVVCGCFHDTLNAFEERVTEVHGNNRYGKVYMAAIEFVRKVINTAE